MIFFGFSTQFLMGQNVQTRTVIIEFKTVNLNEVAINGSSRSAEVNIDPIANTTTISLDPTTIQSNNIEFDDAIKEADFEPFIFQLTIDPLMLDFQSRQNEPVDVACSATINGITEKIQLHLLVTSKKTNSMNYYVLTGNGTIPLKQFELEEKLAILKEDIQFLFTQNITASYR